MTMLSDALDDLRFHFGNGGYIIRNPLFWKPLYEDDRVARMQNGISDWIEDNCRGRVVPHYDPMCRVFLFKFSRKADAALFVMTFDRQRCDADGLIWYDYENHSLFNYTVFK